jgi:hypothetical protein
MVRSTIFGQLEAALAGYLADVVYRAEFGDERAAAAVARHDLPRVVEALKAVLDEHAPDQYGRCPNCRHTRFGRAPAPCRAYLSAHLCLAVAEDEPRPIEVTKPIRRQIVLAEPSAFSVLRTPG